MTSETSDRTRLTIRLADEITDVPTEKIARKLRKKYGLTVIEVLAEAVTRDS
jgi:hypothetical protein